MPARYQASAEKDDRQTLVFFHLMTRPICLVIGPGEGMFSNVMVISAAPLTRGLIIGFLRSCQRGDHE
jgi:hypothetical protein